jgi:hypothetical protein
MSSFAVVRFCKTRLCRKVRLAGRHQRVGDPHARCAASSTLYPPKRASSLIKALKAPTLSAHDWLPSVRPSSSHAFRKVTSGYALKSPSAPTRSVKHSVGNPLTPIPMSTAATSAISLLNSSSTSSAYDSFFGLYFCSGRSPVCVSNQSHGSYLPSSSFPCSSSDVTGDPHPLLVQLRVCRLPHQILVSPPRFPPTLVHKAFPAAASNPFNLLSCLFYTTPCVRPRNLACRAHPRRLLGARHSNLLVGTCGHKSLHPKQPPLLSKCSVAC